MRAAFTVAARRAPRVRPALGVGGAARRRPSRPPPRASLTRIDDDGRGMALLGGASTTSTPAPNRELVRLSARVLKGLTYRPTGAIVAAPTTSLPGDGRRRAQLGLPLLLDPRLEPHARGALHRRVHRRGRGVHLVHDQRGRRPGRRGLAADHVRDRRRARPVRARARRICRGWRDSRPVRVGNGAWNQVQLDVYGELLNALHLYRERLGDLHPEIQAFVADLADTAARRWTRDATRASGRCAASRATTSPPRCCAGPRSTARSSSRRSSASTRRPRSGPRRATRSATPILERGWSEARQAYAQSFDSDELDAAVLLMPIYGFLPATDPRMRATIEAIARDLTEDGLVLRYRNQEGVNADGLTGEEGTFVICSFWLVELPGQGGRGRARRGAVRAAGRLRERPRAARRGDRHRQRRAARQLPAGLQPHRPDHRRLRDRQGQGAGMSPDFDVIVARRRPGRRALRRPARRGRPARRDRRARAARRRVLLLGLHPVQDAAAPGRGAPGGARGAGRRRGGRRRRRPGGRVRLARLHGLRLRRRRPGALGRGRRASRCCAAAARLDGPGRVAGRRRAPHGRHVVVATGSDAVVPPVPGLRELDGVWTNREATGMREVPRRLLVLGGGPVGVELAQAAARMGASVAIVEGGERLLAREPAAARRRARGGAARRGRRAVPRRSHARRGAPRREADELRARAGGRHGAARRPAARRHRPPAAGATTLGLETVGIAPAPAGIPVDAPHARRRGRVGDRRRHRRLAAHLRRQVPGPDRGGEHPRRPARGRLLRRAARRVHRPAGRRRRRRRRAGRRPPSRSPRSPRTATYTRAYDTKPGFLTLVSDGERLTGAYAVGPEAGEWLGRRRSPSAPRVPLAVFDDVIQPFPTFSEVFLHALQALAAERLAPAPS